MGDSLIYTAIFFESGRYPNWFTRIHSPARAKKKTNKRTEIQNNFFICIDLYNNLRL